MVFLDKYYLTDNGLIYDSLAQLWVGWEISDLRSFTFQS